MLEKCEDLKINQTYHCYNQHEDNSSLEHRLTERMSNPQQAIFSSRPCQLSKIPPHITICPPDEQDVIESQFLEVDEFENDVFESSTIVESPSETSYCDDKHKTHSGRLYLICNAGNTCIFSAQKSPSTSPTHSVATYFPFQVSPPPSTDQWPSPGSSPSSSPTTSSTTKTSVYVQVYRCNAEHFAVISRDSLNMSKPIYLNMRHSRVIPGDCLGRFIVAGDCDSGNIIEFEVPELSSLEQWLDAFQVCTPVFSPIRSFGVGNSGMCGVAPNTPPTPRVPVLPTLTETDEDN